MPRILLDTARVPDTDAELRLYQNGPLFSILIPGSGNLMNSHMYGSERALAELACAHLTDAAHPRVLVGGLGMGFTLAAALAVVGPQAHVVVAELVPEVVDWNHRWIGEPAGHPLRDPRAEVYTGDVGDLLRQPGDGFDAILLDVDNGPEALLRSENDWLYAAAGLSATRRVLRPGGVLAVWSAAPHAVFARRLQGAGFEVHEHVVRAHRSAKSRRKGSRHYIWLASVQQRQP